ncbi:uncharacterized protein YecT (DUF1311 family) [Hoeflea marina]|uniref:Uncharacterized protein YecT (DUF1311 family) n=1 Tax=Hoeflea marina TaxID=274592 RepID=A0A317PQ76_9HYPH|nr:lysozyme inhibitor LprI family protein [Hoeflea marina]PWW01740.1 uncharacterized protein YecT (DUF1311 family) [Hoeflea marina]
MSRPVSKATLLGLAVAGLLPVAASLAEDLPDCNDPQDQMSMTYCAGVDYETADQALNALWPSVVAAAKANDESVADQARSMGVPTTLQALRAAQHAWISFRDAQCEYEAYAAFGGTMQPMLGSLCLARMTNERIAELKAAMEGLQ